MIVFIALFLLLVSCVSVGLKVTKLLYKDYQNISLLTPLVGLGIVTFITSNVFLASQNYYLSILLIGITTLASFYKLTIDDVKILGKKLLIWLLGFGFLLIPYLINFTPGELIINHVQSNDTVIHSIIARNPEDNEHIREKIGDDDAVINITNDLPRDITYNKSVHSVVNLVSNISDFETSKLITLSAIYFYSFTIFALVFWAKTFVGGLKLKWINSILISLAGLTTYYSIAVVYHGFLTQISYLGFLFALPIFLEKIDFKNIKTLIIPALLVASSIGFYGIGAVFTLGVILLIFTIPKIIESVRKGELKELLISISFGIFATLILMGLNLLDFINIFSKVFGRTIGDEESNLSGNLTDFINPHIISGIWYEKDYRFTNYSSGVLSHLFLLTNMFVSGIGIFAVFDLWKDKINQYSKMFIKLFVALIISYLIVTLLIRNPYTSSKVLSTIPPLFILLILIGVRKIVENGYILLIMVAGFICVSMYSNIYMMENSEYETFEELDKFRNLNAEIPEDRVLFYALSDWAIYYNDTTEIDIKNETYFRDKHVTLAPENFRAKYDLIIFNEPYEYLIPNFMCDRVYESRSIGVGFKFCELK